jgi:hypothetical protein
MSISERKLEPGMLIQTNYEGPYRIKSIERDCNCPSYSQRHICMTATKPDGTDMYYLNGWIEETLLSIDKTYFGHKTELDYDTITILPNDKPIQTSLF